MIATRHDRIIDLFGGNTVLAGLIGSHHSTVSRWRINGIPPRLWTRIVRLARVYASEEVTIEELTAGHDARRARAAPQRGPGAVEGHRAATHRPR